MGYITTTGMKNHRQKSLLLYNDWLLHVLVKERVSSESQRIISVVTALTVRVYNSPTNVPRTLIIICQNVEEHFLISGFLSLLLYYTPWLMSPWTHNDFGSWLQLLVNMYTMFGLGWKVRGKKMEGKKEEWKKKSRKWSVLWSVLMSVLWWIS